MIIRDVGDKHILAAREEGMEYGKMDTFAYTGTITEAINELKKDGYKIFYLAEVQYAIDTHLKYVDEE